MIGGGYLAAGALALSVASGIGGYFHGLETGEARERADNQRAIDKANAARDRLRELIEQAALKHLQAEQTRQSTSREIIRDSQKILERPVYRNQCVDADGVRLLDRAAANANGDNPAAPAVASTTPAERPAQR
jgi:hypothetical protein